MSSNAARGSSHPVTHDRALLAIAWVFASIATVSLCTRLFVRLRRFGKLYWDDLFVIIAWMFSIPLVAQVTVSTQESAALSDPTNSLFISRPLVQLCFYTCLWSIKISFLLFFRRIGSNTLGRVKLYWKIVLGFTILSYFVLWAFNPYSCWVKKGLTNCDFDHTLRWLWPVSYSMATALDIVTDLLIMAIPFAILAHVRLSTRQKLILYSLFSLVVFTMATALTRVIISVTGFKSKGGLTVTLLLFLGDMEANTAIFVACIGSIRTLFTQDDRSRTPAYHRSWVSPPIRPPRPRTESTDAIISADIRDPTSKSLKSVIQMDELETAPKAQAVVKSGDIDKV